MRGTLRLAIGTATAVAVLLALGAANSVPVMAQAGAEASASTGTLRVFVPAGMVGDEYWIYVNGRIATHPPQPHHWRHDDLWVIRRQFGRAAPHGWELRNDDGFILSMSGEDGEGIARYINHNFGNVPNCSISCADLRDPAHVFEPAELTLRPGAYTVDVVISSPPSPVSSYPKSNFPFVVTRSYEADVHAGETSGQYFAVPDNWDQGPGASPARAAGNSICGGSLSYGGNPNISGIGKEAEGLIKAYTSDPMVKLVRAAAATGARPNGTVVLDLPAEEGGSREFDGLQIQRITDSIALNYSPPEHRELEECRAAFPTEMNRVSVVYGKIIDFINQDIASFHALAAEMKRGGDGN